MQIEIYPDLEACVHTKAKRQFEETIRELLNKGEDEELIERLDPLQLFLESADFSKLRSESEKHLVQGRRVIFTLWLEDGKLKYEMSLTD